VCKWFKPELQAFNRYAEKFFTEDVKMVDKALRILREWNMRGLSNGVTLQMIRPEVWEFEPGARGSWAGRKVLQEPFIESFVKCWSTPSLVPPPPAPPPQRAPAPDPEREFDFASSGVAQGIQTPAGSSTLTRCRQ
jgi:hypothetical protein